MGGEANSLCLCTTCATITRLLFRGKVRRRSESARRRATFLVGAVGNSASDRLPDDLRGDIAIGV